MTVTRGLGRRRLVGLLAASFLLAGFTIVFSLPALGKGSSPSSECASTDPAWNGDFWKVEKDDGILGEIETTVAGAISLAANGSWTNNHEDPIFRVVLKFDDDYGDDDDDDDEVQVLSGMWETGEGATIGVALDELDHVTFCSTSEVVEEPEPTTTTTMNSTTTTSAAVTTTTTSVAPTTTPAGPTTTTIPDASPAATPGEPTTTQPSPNDTTSSAATGSVEASDSSLAGDSSQAGESAGEGEDGVDETDQIDPTPDTDRDTTAIGPLDGGPGGPTAPGQESSDVFPDFFRSPHQWTLADLAILAALVSAIALVAGRRTLRRFVGQLGDRWR